jgi:hypothetical protein
MTAILQKKLYEILKRNIAITFAVVVDVDVDVAVDAVVVDVASVVILVGVVDYIVDDIVGMVVGVVVGIDATDAEVCKDKNVLQLSIQVDLNPNFTKILLLFLHSIIYFDLKLCLVSLSKLVFFLNSRES